MFHCPIAALVAYRPAHFTFEEVNFLYLFHFQPHSPLPTAYLNTTLVAISSLFPPPRDLKLNCARQSFRSSFSLPRHTAIQLFRNSLASQACISASITFFTRFLTARHEPHVNMPDIVNSDSMFTVCDTASHSRALTAQRLQRQWPC